MSDRERLSERLHSRSVGLSRRQMPGGGEAFSGPLANKALKTLGARAMTMDHNVFVQSGFDPSKGDDLALWAHESHHQQESGGSDNHSAMDGEERAARARERLVLHQSQAGHDPDAILAGLDQHNPLTMQEADDVFAHMEQNSPEDESGDPHPLEAYRNMMRDGMTHSQVVGMLADHCVNQIQRHQAEEGLRTASDGE